MFFFSITKRKITDDLQCVGAKEIKVDSLIFSIVTDSFLSKLISTEDGFSIIESPLISYPHSDQIIFSEITFRNSKKCFEIFRSTISGRPIYYYLNPQGEFFCSTHISMLRRAGVRIEENTKLLPEFFVYRYVIPPQTLYKNIRQVPAGSRLRVGLVGENCNICQCNGFQPPVSDDSKVLGTIETISTRTLELLTDSCYPLKPLNDEIAVLLSGGLDSSVLLKTCQNLYDIETTYSTGFPFEKPNNNLEKEYALSAAQAFGVRHSYYESSVENYLLGILQAISAAEEPLHHQSSAMLYLLFRNHLPKEKTIVICGMGADGIFGSSLHNRLFRMRNVRGVKLLSRHPIINILKTLSRITGRGKSLIGTLYRNPDSQAPLADVDHVLWLLGKYGDDEWVRSYFGVSSKDIILNRYNVIRSFQGRLLFDMISILSFLGGTSVTQAIWAKLGEANGKIIFYPFTDCDLIKHAFSVPWDLKLLEPKNILREVARQLSVPEYIISRAKKGFGIVDERWGEKDSVYEPLVPLAAKVLEEKQIRSMQSIQPQKAMTFWNILNYSIWKRLCIDDEPLKVLEEELFEAISKTGNRKK
jgi:asparagine synthase (glutamine-hydrolysing)